MEILTIKGKSSIYLKCQRRQITTLTYRKYGETAMIERESKNTHQMGFEGEILTSSIFLQDNKGLLFFSKGVNKLYQKKKT